MRMRSFVMEKPVAFLNRRRNESVPSDLLVPVSAESRTRPHALAGLLDEAHCGSGRLALICALRWTGLCEFSGPGAPKADCTPPNEPAVVETKTKSGALSF